MSTRHSSCAARGWLWFIILLSLSVSTVDAAPARIHNLQVVTVDQQPRFVITSDRAIAYQLFALSDPQRLVIDLTDATLATDPKKMAVENTVIKQLRVQQHTPNKVRMVLELHHPIPLPTQRTGNTATLSIALAATPAQTSSVQKAALPQPTPTPDNTPLADKNNNKLQKLLFFAEHENNAVAQNRLGTYYYQGDGVPKDYQRAAQWFHRAAIQGLAEAQHNLGMLYARGVGVHRSYTRAVDWLTKASQQGQVTSQYNLAIMYLQGLGVKKNPSQAFSWLNQAAQQDHPGAQYLLGILYSQGTGVKKNFIQGYTWLSIARKQGVVAADKILPVLTQQMTKAAISKAQQRVKDYFAAHTQSTVASSPKPG